jgi:hypothetical protein
VRRQFSDWTPHPDRSSEKDSQFITEVHVAAGDRHGHPDTGPHIDMPTPRHTDDNIHSSADVPIIDDKSVNTNGPRLPIARDYHGGAEIDPHANEK